MFKIIREITFHDEEVIFEQGSEDKTVYIVMSGAVKLFQKVHGETIVVEVMRSGQLFGEMAFIGQIQRTATARAMGVTVLGVVDPVSLKQELDSLSPAMRGVLENLVVRLKKTTENSVGISFIRREPRVLKTLSVAFEKENALLEAFSHDVSCGGIFIKTHTPLRKGEVFMLHLKLPDGLDPLKIKSRVVWIRPESADEKSQPAGMGVEFMNPSADCHNRLRAVIKAVKP